MAGFINDGSEGSAESRGQRSQNLVLPGLQTRWLGRSCRAFDSTDSTNLRLWEWAADAAPHGATCLAAEQSSGKGRQGRSWISSRGQGLYASLLLRVDGTLADVLAFSLVVALVVARTVDELTGTAAAVKWPNDVWVGERKLAGILLESQGGNGEGASVVVGVGINLRAPEDGWPEEIRHSAIALEDLTPRLRLDTETLWSSILNHLEPAWERFVAHGFGAFLGEWAARSLLEGRSIRLEGESKPFTAKVLGVDEHGRLLVRTAAGADRALVAGEVHLLPGEPT